MAVGDIIVGIDIGASKISIVVGDVNNFNQIEVICKSSSKSSGIQKGKIIDESALADSIAEAVSTIEKENNISINSAYITIPGKYVTIVQNSITKEAKDKYSGISSKDVASAISQAKEVEIPEDKQFIDILAENFVLDDGRITDDPIGAFSESFTLNAQVLLADREFIKSIESVFRRIDVKIDGIVPSTLADKSIALDETDLKDFVMLLDIGAANTDIGVFASNTILYTNTISVGGRNITNDIKQVLNISYEEAEKLKKQYGLALKSYMDSDNEVVLTTVKDGDKIIKSSLIVEIIEARIEEIFELVNKDITANGLKQNINTVILIGQGIANISKSDIVGRITLNIPVKMATSKALNSVRPTYSTAYALVKYIASRPFIKTVSSNVDSKSGENFFSKVWDRIKEFFYS